MKTEHTTITPDTLKEILRGYLNMGKKTEIDITVALPQKDATVTIIGTPEPKTFVIRIWDGTIFTFINDAEVNIKKTADNGYVITAVGNNSANSIYISRMHIELVTFMED